MKFGSVAVAGAALLFAACGASTQSARFVQSAPVPDDQPIKYFSTRLPTCPYDELGIVRGARRTPFTKLQKVLDAMAAEARRMGGDAIVGFNQESVVTQTASEGGGAQTSQMMAGTVVKFTSPGCVT